VRSGPFEKNGCICSTLPRHSPSGTNTAKTASSPSVVAFWKRVLNQMPRKLTRVTPSVTPTPSSRCGR
jgi:hypothetical protein